MASYAYTFTSGDTVTPTKLNNARTVSEIVNADVSATAAIAGTKVAPAFGAQDITVSTANRSITNTGNFALSFGTNNTERMQITAAGGVGVGTAGILANSLLTASQGVAARVDAAGQTPYLQLYNSNAGADLKTWRIGGNSDGRLSIEAVNDAYSASNERVTVTAAGNVGIGTTTTTQRLNVGGSIHLAGAELRYISTSSEHLAFTKKAGGPFHFYFRKTDDGSIDGANLTDMFVIKNAGQVKFCPLASDPAGAESGDVYYNSSTNKLKVYNGTSWVDLH